MYLHRDMSTYLITQRDVNTSERNLLFLLTYFPKTGVDTSLCLSPSGSGKRSHMGRASSRHSYCFPGETTQEAKLLQETLNRALIVPSSEFWDTMDPIHRAYKLKNSPLVWRQLWGHQIFINRLAWISVNYFFKKGIE